MNKSETSLIKELLKIEESKPLCDERKTIWVLPDGTTHRVYGPAVEWVDGEKQWFYMGKLHREDGPAIEYQDGSYEWFLNDKRHRPDGFALEYKDRGIKEYWIHGIQVEQIKGLSLLSKILKKVTPKINYRFFSK